jgi:hypothetical protein
MRFQDMEKVKLFPSPEAIAGRAGWPKGISQWKARK